MVLWCLPDLVRCNLIVVWYGLQKKFFFVGICAQNSKECTKMCNNNLYNLLYFLHINAGQIYGSLVHNHT